LAHFNTILHNVVDKLVVAYFFVQAFRRLAQRTDYYRVACTGSTETINTIVTIYYTMSVVVVNLCETTYGVRQKSLRWLCSFQWSWYGRFFGHFASTWFGASL